MYEGTIYVAGKIGSLGNDATMVDINEDELLEIWDILDKYGLEQKPKFKKIVSGRKLYHLDSLERLEKASI